MKCNQFAKWELGKISDHDFQIHAQSCSDCRHLIKQDEQLMVLARSLKKPVEAPGLWKRIEKNLEAEKLQNTFSRNSFYFQAKIILRIAAAVLLAIGLTYVLLLPRNDLNGTNLLAETALRKVEKREKAYIKAIERLEKNIQPKLAEIDLEMSLLYRDRLETIDTQIEQCREALSANPANAHIRRYMMAALQDKKETLKELMKS